MGSVASTAIDVARSAVRKYADSDAMRRLIRRILVTMQMPSMLFYKPYKSTHNPQHLRSTSSRPQSTHLSHRHPSSHRQTSAQ